MYGAWAFVFVCLCVFRLRMCWMMSVQRAVCCFVPMAITIDSSIGFFDSINYATAPLLLHIYGNIWCIQLKFARFWERKKICIGFRVAEGEKEYRTKYYYKCNGSSFELWCLCSCYKYSWAHFNWSNVPRHRINTADYCQIRRSKSLIIWNRMVFK